VQISLHVVEAPAVPAALRPGSTAQESRHPTGRVNVFHVQPVFVLESFPAIERPPPAGVELFPVKIPGLAVIANLGLIGQGRGSHKHEHAQQVD